jgi:HEAT repeat protein
MAQSTNRTDVASFAATRDFFDSFAGSTARQRARIVARAPLADIHVAALRHPDPLVRRWCLGYLDHYANDASMAVFAAALRDPVDYVRNVALHSLACEACKSEELCVADVVPGLIEVLQEDPNPDLRTKAIASLMRLSATDPRARSAVERAASSERDPLVRRAAADALVGRLVPPRKRYQREQRRHAKQHGSR